MNQQIKQNIIKIKQVADEILEEHENSKVRFGGINYADLRIVDVSYNLHLDGELEVEE